MTGALSHTSTPAACFLYLSVVPPAAHSRGKEPYKANCGYQRSNCSHAITFTSPYDHYKAED